MDKIRILRKKGYESPFFFLFAIDYTFKLDIIFVERRVNVMTLEELKTNEDLMKEMDLNEILTSIKEEMSDDNLNEVVEVLKNSRIQRYIQYLISKQTTGESIGEEDYQNLYLIVYILQTIYTEADEESPVSDYDYDMLYELMKGYVT